MQILLQASVICLAYIFGSIPFGLLIVKVATGKDLREVASGRTGGTNAARAAGAGAGLLTAVMDGAKGASAVWMAQAVAPSNHWLHVLAPIAAILGHNYSIFLTERDANNHLRLRGGAGGGPTVGGAIGLWWQSAFIVLPLLTLVFFGIGYASITTMSAALFITVIFAVRYRMGLATVPDIYYGVIAFPLLVWALRPNIKALIEGRERFHGWRPWRKAKIESPVTKTPRGKKGRVSSSTRKNGARKGAPTRRSASSRG